MIKIRDDIMQYAMMFANKLLYRSNNYFAIMVSCEVPNGYSPT